MPVNKKRNIERDQVKVFYRTKKEESEIMPLTKFKEKYINSDAFRRRIKYVQFKTTGNKYSVFYKPTKGFSYTVVL